MRSVLVSTNEPIVEVGLKALLADDQEFRLLHVCRSDSEVQEWARSRPDVILYGLPLDAGMAPIRHLRLVADKSSIVFGAARFVPGLAQQLVALGVKGFLDATASPDSIRDCLRLSSMGEIWMERGLTTRLLNFRSIDLSPAKSVDRLAGARPEEQGNRDFHGNIRGNGKSVFDHSVRKSRR